MLENSSDKLRGILVGILILVAYSMLTYDISQHIIAGVIADIVSGVAVIGIAVLMFPIFDSVGNRLLILIYLSSKAIEGILMIIGGIFILSPTLLNLRNIIYHNIHVYFFIIGALAFYILLYRTRVIPPFISLWGIMASVILFIVMMIKLFGIKSVILDVLLLPMILNEVFLAFWLIIKGFNKNIKKNLNFS